MNPLLSILIATRNRIPYCTSIIETILSFEYENFELVIQDNSETLKLKEYIEKRDLDKRLVYNYTPPPFSSVDNFNAVIGLAKGQYLCMIGDDDGINPEIFKVVEWANENNIDTITPGLNVMYRWPDACEISKGFENDFGRLTINHITGEATIHNPQKSLTSLLKQGGQNYLSLHFPKLYHGIVKRECVEMIKKKTGHYVGGLSPDIYLAVGLTFFVRKTIEIDYPLTIPGACMDSVLRGVKPYKRIEDAIHFRDRGPYSWSEQVPKFYSANNIWADSALASLKDFDRFDLVKKFNVTRLSVALLNQKRYKEHTPLILQTYLNHHRATEGIKKAFCVSYLFCNKHLVFLKALPKKVFFKLKNILSRPTKPHGQRFFKQTNIPDIQKATMETEKHLKKFGFSVKQVIKNLEKLNS